MNVLGKHYRTIWLDEKNPELVQIIDQRHLPHEFIIEDLLRVEDFAVAIRDMHIRGAGLIGATAGFGIYSALLSSTANDLDKNLEKAASMLLATRPTAKNLSWAIERQLTALKNISDFAQKKVTALETAIAIADEDARFCKQIGEHGSKIIKDIWEKKGRKQVNVLTHCNAGWLAFVDYGSATAPIYEAKRQGIDIHVWVDETRPWLQGAKLTAWELGQEGIEHTLIPDNTGGHLMQHGMVDLVIVGTDRTTRAGDVANKIGTYLKALAARDSNIPFYVALPSSTFDWSIADGIRDILIEERGEKEVKYITGLNPHGKIDTVLITGPDTKAANYAFDVTPRRLISGLITERGVCRADEKSIAELFPEKYSA